MSVTFMTDVDKTKLEEQLNKKSDRDEFANYNKFVIGEAESGLMNVNGVVEKNSSYHTTGYIPCENGNFVYFSSSFKRPTAMIRAIGYYDADKNLISCSSVNSVQQGGLIKDLSTKSQGEFNMRYITEITNDRCRYIRITYPAAIESTLIVEVRDYDSRLPLDVDYVAGQKYEKPHDTSAPYWQGRTIVWNGDSIPAGYASRAGYPEFVKLHLSCNTINNSIGGTTLAHNPEILEGNTKYRNPLILRYEEMPDNADLVCIAIGTNDWCYSYTPFGDMSSTGTDTFYGALKTLCEGLLNKYIRCDITEEYSTNSSGKETLVRRDHDFSNTQIVFFTPIKRVVYKYDRWDDDKKPIPDSGAVDFAYYQTNECGKTLEDYANAIKEVCGYYGIPVLDLFNECLINPLVDSIKTGYFPLNKEVYIRVENGNEVELTKEQADAYTGTGEIIVTSRRDGTHPNINGHKILARRITGYIKQLADGVF